MASLAGELEQTSRAISVHVTDDAIAVELEDGRTLSVPTAWYPRLFHATKAERANYEIDSVGVVWPDVEADFSIRGLLLGRKSGESTASLQYWLNARKNGRKATFQEFMKSQRKSKTRK